jgi:hypothetical protein
VTIPLVHDITINRRSHWSMSMGYYNPLANGLPDLGSPVDISAWSFEWELLDERNPGTPVSLVTLTYPVGITVADDLTITVSLGSDVAAVLPLMVGIHSLLAIPDSPGFDELLVTGRALVTDGL